MGCFRKKPIVIEAVQWVGNNAKEIMDWSAGAIDYGAVDYHHVTTGTGGLYIKTLEGVMRAERSDWIIKGVNGEFYPCKADIFEKTYEPVT